MSDSFITTLRTVFGSRHTFTETILNDKHLFVHEVKILDTLGHKITQTICSTTQPTEHHFQITNLAKNDVNHICIDGDFIPFGQEKYDSNSLKTTDSRPDCIVFDDKNFLFVELKVEQKPISWNKEDTKWKTFFGGVAQIEDFVNYWRANNFEIKNHYQNIIALVCMRFEPNFSIKSRGNNARNTEIFKRSQRLGFTITAHNHQNSYLL
jgi:hypothetical protein